VTVTSATNVAKANLVLIPQSIAQHAAGSPWPVTKESDRVFFGFRSSTTFTCYSLATLEAGYFYRLGLAGTLDFGATSWVIIDLSLELKSSP
jgi:hypothetical protein